MDRLHALPIRKLPFQISLLAGQGLIWNFELVPGSDCANSLRRLPLLMSGIIS